MASQEDYYDFSEAHIDQIIEATRLKGVDLDRRALLNDLIECYERYKKIVSAGSFRRHRERLISIRKHIDRAVKLIGEDNNDLGVIGKGTEGKSDDFTFLSRCLSNWIDLIINGQLGGAARYNRMRHGLTASALQELTGSYLREVYERHFKKAGTSRSEGGDGSPQGPYIRFVTAVLSCWEMDCSPETIDDALGRKI